VAIKGCIGGMIELSGRATFQREFVFAAKRTWEDSRSEMLMQLAREGVGLQG
jgi:hypothetical protein